MKPEPEKTQTSPLKDQPETCPEEEQLTEEEQATLSDAQLQDKYRRAYLLQQARRSCPGCGEDDLPL